MKLKIITVFAILSAAQALSAQTNKPDEVMKKHFAAIGQDRLDRKTTLIWKGTSNAGPFTLYQKRPNRVRIEAKYQGADWIRGYDGKKAWIIAPWLGTSYAQDLTDGPQYDQLISLSQFDGPLHKPEAIGGKLEFAGSGDVDGKAAFKLKLTDADGTVNYLFIDAKNYFLVKQTTLVRDNPTNQETEVVTLFKNYKKFEGVFMAFHFEILSPQGANKIIVESLEFDKKIDDAFFDKPAMKTAKQ